MPLKNATFRKVYHVDGGPVKVHGQGPRILQSKGVRQVLKALHDTKQMIDSRRPKFSKNR